jgi:hypothetical protein
MFRVCLFIPPKNFLMPEPIFMKLGVYIMPPEPVSAAYFKIPPIIIIIIIGVGLSP